MLKGLAQVFLISAMGYYKTKQNYHPSTKVKNSFQIQISFDENQNKNKFNVFFECFLISNIFLNYFPHIIQVKHIICEMLCEKDISSNLLSTVWEIIKTKYDKRKHLRKTHNICLCSHQRIFEFWNF